MAAGSSIHLAVLAGVLATGGGVFAKLSGYFAFTGDLWSPIAKLLLLGAMVVSNTLGCTLFVKAMVGSSSSLPATVASSTVNYFCSALLGWLVFGESTSLTWWCGTTLVLLGLLCICNSPESNEVVTDDSKKLADTSGIQEEEDDDTKFKRE
ncbi:uncharacterized protein LOC106642702 [Copidosoma floridanum]|uniref:uncharacterized protein LOC106642702 n=1 Tax=Copidosoma floridanum TaxID=29053 RepID=UPI0006C9B5C1|nr:uncharacterized protein LOC106642702 [Copidosoma floridanum]